MCGAERLSCVTSASSATVTPLTIAIVMPVWHEPELDAALDRLGREAPDQIIVVEADDGANHTTQRAWTPASTASTRYVSAIRTARGRAAQMNAGARLAAADILVFLHADTRLPGGALACLRAAVAAGAVWGRFDVRLSGANLAFRVIERCMNMRSAITGIATGDQAIFVRRDVFARLGGFADVELMEDIELSKRLKRVAHPLRIDTPVITSSRRWERNGIARTVVRMWALRALYALGVPPRRLAQWYK
jgi:rSAM/selenodomain-associated transferase 2